MPRFNIPAEDAQGPLVVGIDIGSGGTRAAVYDVSGRELGKLNHKEAHEFTVADDGNGLDAREGLGLRGMRTRLAAAGGRLQLDSGAGGTRLTATVPMGAA